MHITLLIIHQYLPFKNPITVIFPVENDYVNCIFFANVVIDLARDSRVGGGWETRVVVAREEF